MPQRCSAKERQVFINAVITYAPIESAARHAELAADLMREASTYGRLQETECNRELSKRERDDETRCAARLTLIAQRLGVGLKLGGDPRGYTVKVLFPKDAQGRRPYNTWGGEEDGWGVPTS